MMKNTDTQCLLENSIDTTEQSAKIYYYHADHLQSAQFITDANGEKYEHIEYTPYGELWIEETAPGVDKLPFRFTGKELDEETGLYYYGARYLDPKYSRWLSGDPALGEYVSKDYDGASGGIYNTINLNIYHYGGNNPIRYVDPDGEEIKEAIEFFKGWFSYNLTKGLSAGNHSIQPPVYNPIYEKANDIVNTIYNVGEQIHSNYIEGLTFISDASGTATLFFLAIGQPEIAGVTGTAGMVADGLLALDNLASNNYSEGFAGFASISISFGVGQLTGYGLEKVGNSINITIGKNGLYYMKGRRGALKTTDGIRKQLYKDLVSGYFGQNIAPEVASQLTDSVMDEIYKKQSEEKLNE